jgi:hypothetical protein
VVVATEAKRSHWRLGASSKVLGRLPVDNIKSSRANGQRPTSKQVVTEKS